MFLYNMVLRQPNLAIRKQIKNKIHLREAGLATAQDTRQEERMVCSGFIYYWEFFLRPYRPHSQHLLLFNKK